MDEVSVADCSAYNMSDLNKTRVYMLLFCFASFTLLI